MKRKRVWTIMTVLALLLLCCGCQKGDGSYLSHLEKVAQMEQTGENTYISGVRTGIKRTGLVWGNHAFECTDDGVYYLSHCYVTQGNEEPHLEDFLFFSPHDSDTMIKLCGRPDCSHNSASCNACFPGATAGCVTYYDGYLYIPVSSENPEKYLLSLYRVDLDGSNRVKVGDFGDGSVYHGYSQVMILDGTFTYYLSRLDPTSGKVMADRFYYALDGSMKEPAMATNVIAFFNQEWTDTRTVQEDGVLLDRIYSVDIRNDQWELLYETEYLEDGYWGQEFGYALDGSTLYRIHYQDGRREALFDTGLEGGYRTRFFPDCLVFTQTEDENGELPEVPVMYFYSWEGERLGELAIDFPYTVPAVQALIDGESKDRFYIQTSQKAGTLPEFYLEKSDFGTGQMKLHRIQYPDFTEEEMELMFVCRNWNVE